METVNEQKLRGGYYTPKDIAVFLNKWAINAQTRTVLEPSCGDGNFVAGAIERFHELGINGAGLTGRIKAVELLEIESIKARSRANNLDEGVAEIINSDFFEYIENHPNDRYDVIIGNPPFIRYQNFPEEHRRRAIAMMQALGLSPNKLTNIWVPFLVVSASLLTQRGKLAMVIPAELFQVKYAAETRVFLSNFFQRITIVTFKKLVFSDIQQEVVLLLCEREAEENQGIRVVELENMDALSSLELEAIHQLEAKDLAHDSEKWTKYFMETEEINLLRTVKEDKRISLAKTIMDTNVGLVTGRNDFFMLDAKTADKWGIREYTKPVASRSNHFKGIVFNQNDLDENIENQLDCFLFLPPDVDFDELPLVCQEYIRYGEQEEFHTGYKCKIRKRWYITPSVYVPDGFALRQVGDYPKIIINNTNASSTDTIHRVRFKTSLAPELIEVSFLNSLTFAFSEITGRSYGGGVLTFEPTEIGELPLPLLSPKTKIDFGKIDRLIRERKIVEVLDIVDEALLIKQLGYAPGDVKKMRNIWEKLSGRRQNRK